MICFVLVCFNCLVARLLARLLARSFAGLLARSLARSLARLVACLVTCLLGCLLACFGGSLRLLSVWRNALTWLELAKLVLGLLGLVACFTLICFALLGFTCLVCFWLA